MNITIEYVFITPELHEIKKLKRIPLKTLLKNVVIVIGKDWIINIIFVFLIK